MEEEQMAEELKEKRICRFCLTQTEPLSDIFSTNAEASDGSKKSTPLTLQIMACVAIEVYKDDGMPATICDNCRALMDHSYRFKQICKKADTLLKTYPLTGVWPERLQVPVNLFKSAQPVTVPVKAPQLPVKQLPVKAPVQRKPVPKPTPIRQTVTVIPGIDKPVKTKQNKQLNVEEEEEEEQELQPVDQSDEDPLADIKPKIVKLSIEDLRSIKQGKPISKTQLIKKTPPAARKNKIQVLNSEVIVPSAESTKKTSPTKQHPVKVINGSLPLSNQPILLNSLKSARQVTEHFLHTSEGTLEIVTTEMLERDPMKIAPPVETNVFPCSECERSFPLRQLLEIHMQNHNRERKFPCDLCDKRFFSKYDLAKHNLTHTGERPYVCIICKAAFSRSTLLTRHQKVHKDQPKFICMYCERTFLSNEELQKHAINHEKVRPFKCMKCPKTFAYKQGLERHEITHDKNLPFPCEHCDLSFATAGKLARHLTAHAGNRPYPCRWCNRAFMLSHHLTRHVRAHQGGQGAYKCTECTEVYYSQDELIYHSAVHATESKTCPLCREQFDSLEQVTDHIKHHSEGVQYACDYCDLLFTSEKRLDDHCQAEHLSVLAMEAEELQAAEASKAQQDAEEAQQYIIEEIEIGTDGSKTITKFGIDGQVKEKKLVRQGKTIKNEVVTNDNTAYAEEEEEEEAYSQEDEDGFMEQDWPSEEEEDSQEVTKAAPPQAKSQPAYKPGVSKLQVSKPVTSTPAPKTATQKKLDSFFKKESPSSAPAAKSVNDVLQKLPKGMIVKRPTAVVKPEATKTPPLPKRPSEPPKTSPRLAGKRPREESETPVPTKKPTIESKPGPASSKPRAQPASTSSSSSSLGEVKKGKTFEMKIGNKMVKVQKVVMTKAEVAAMARDGKIEMQGETMILKQQKGKK
ncbi:zinc finger and SCAN domain-containing protein 10-like [Culex pipiens pallens]|uniref:zinc finger and SCAN domain-containing protein 10-like n=1 Tax=Culex pipiens pallens TaxID=42434 RepID=UPI001954F268|nr:zinc finger and SCAN domain-containing protein 10-like [Culex pipiens pallens]